jgi:hypothetical protein
MSADIFKEFVLMFFTPTSHVTGVSALLLKNELWRNTIFYKEA